MLLLNSLFIGTIGYNGDHLESKSMEKKIVIDETNIKFQERLFDDSLLLYLEDKGRKSIYIISDQTNYFISNDSPSKPSISPDKRRFAYISPQEWEVIGDLYLYDVETKNKKTIVSHTEIPNQFTPKAVEWLNNRYLVIIIGYAYGTINMGGSLYVFDSETNQLSLAIVPEEQTEFRDIKVGKFIVIISNIQAYI